MTQPKLYDSIMRLATKLVSKHPEPKTHLGAEFVDVPADKPVLITATYRPSPSKRIEINITTQYALPAFEWLAEITTDDKELPDYRHYLLKPEGEIVEAYGRNLFPVETDTAQALLVELQQLDS